jgi:hypothetical protein
MVTFMAYQLGDAIDKAIYKPHIESRLDRRFPRLVSRLRHDAQIVLGIQEGTYQVAKSLAGIAGEYEGTEVQLWNELAKFARSVALPLILVPLFIQFENLSAALLLPVAGVILFVVYLLLKPFHIRLLYRKINGLIEEDEDGKYACHDFPSAIRLFFWDGEFVASERLNRAPHI